jgi:hypothetical protein
MPEEVTAIINIKVLRTSEVVATMVPLNVMWQNSDAKHTIRRSMRFESFMIVKVHATVYCSTCPHSQPAQSIRVSHGNCLAFSSLEDKPTDMISPYALTSCKERNQIVRTTIIDQLCTELH